MFERSKTDSLDARAALDEKDPTRLLLAGLPNFPGLEAFHRQREFLNSPQSLLGLVTPPSLLPPSSTNLNFPPLPRPPSQPPTPSSQTSSSPVQHLPGGGSGGGGGSNQQNWSFEEQFKQVSQSIKLFRDFVIAPKTSQNSNCACNC